MAGGVVGGVTGGRSSSLTIVPDAPAGPDRRLEGRAQVQVEHLVRLDRGVADDRDVHELARLARLEREGAEGAGVVDELRGEPRPRPRVGRPVADRDQRGARRRERDRERERARRPGPPLDRPRVADRDRRHGRRRRRDGRRAAGRDEAGVGPVAVVVAPAVGGVVHDQAQLPRPARRRGRPPWPSRRRSPRRCRTRGVRRGRRGRRRCRGRRPRRRRRRRRGTARTARRGRTARRRWSASPARARTAVRRSTAPPRPPAALSPLARSISSGPHPLSARVGPSVETYVVAPPAGGVGGAGSGARPK